MYQNVPLFPTMTVLENVSIGQMAGRFKRRELAAQLASISDKIGYGFDPDEIVGEMSIGRRHMVAVAQALATEAKVILLDEPTASLGDAESRILFRVVRQLCEQGVSFVFCTHFLKEVLEHTDTVTVMRDGRTIATQASAELDEAGLVRLMAGREVERSGRKSQERLPQVGPPRLLVTGLRTARLPAVDFEVQAGEIVGVAGLMGSGRSALLHAIFGSDRRMGGSVEVDGQVVGASPQRAILAGIALVAEDRNSQGLHSSWEIWRNATLPHLARYRLGVPLLSRRREYQRGTSLVGDLGVVAADCSVPVGQLSGGNAQKVALGRWLDPIPRVLLLDEPTAGVDIAAKADILVLIRDLAAQGVAIVIVSSEFEELTNTADRVLVLDRGLITAERDTDSVTETELLSLMSGLNSSPIH